SELKGLGPKSAEKFHQLEIYTIEDLLIYYPFRYEDFKSKSVFDLQDGEKAVLTGQVVTPATVQYYGFKRNRLSFKIKQDELVIAVNFFNQPYLADKVEIVKEVAIFGKWDQKKAALTGMKFLMSLEDDLQPVYHTVQGVSQTALIKSIKASFDSNVLDQIKENIPALLLQ
ncbi:DNA helicase RecG, partial [Streptococcus parauberis]